MKKWFKGFLLTKAGRRQLVGIVTALIASTAWGAAHPEFIKTLTDNWEVLVGSIIAVVSAIGAADADSVADANAQKAKQ